MPTVTALRATAPGRVAVELDGRPWRTLPLEAVLHAGLDAGTALDRPRARTLRREVRRLEALGAATRALRQRDLSEHALADRLERRGITSTERAATVETLKRAGFVDDARFAQARAALLAERGYGDAYVRDDLARNGVARETCEHAIQGLPPEDERVAAVVARRGESIGTLRFLARRGFGEEALARLVAAVAPGELG